MTMGRISIPWRSALLALALLAYGGVLQAHEQKRTPTWAPTDVRGISVRIHTGSPYHHLFIGNEDQLAWVVRNEGRESMACEMDYAIESYDGSRRESRFTLQVPAGGESRQPIARQVLGDCGIKWVSFRLSDGQQETKEQKISFVYFEPAGPTPGKQRGGFLFSTGYGGGPEPFNEENQELIALAGFKAARFNPAWGRIQPREDIWNWERLDEAMANHEKYGLQPQFLLYGSPRWAINHDAVEFHEDPRVRKRQEQFHKSPTQSWPPQLDAYRAFTGAVARRYGDRVRAYEMWNEPDINFYIGSVEYYIEMLKAGFQGVKSVDPELPVSSGGVAALEHHLRKPGMVEAIFRDGRPYFDYYGHHRHGEFRFLVEEMPKVQALMKQHGVRKPIYFTETAMDSRFGERHQAETLIKKAVYCWSLGAVGYTWFNVHDTYDPARQHGEWYGLYTFTGYPKAAYAAHATLARNLLHLSFRRKYTLKGENVYAYAFSGEGRVVLVAWREDSDMPSLSLTLETTAPRITKIDIMGNSERLSVTHGSVQLTLDTAPSFYVVHNADDIPTLRR